MTVPVCNEYRDILAQWYVMLKMVYWYVLSMYRYYDMYASHGDCHEVRVWPGTVLVFKHHRDHVPVIWNPDFMYIHEIFHVYPMYMPS